MPDHPDIDPDLLEVQREIAEARRFLEAREQRDALRAEVFRVLKDTWRAKVKYGYLPEDVTFKRWLLDASPDEVERAIVITGKKLRYGLYTADSAKLYMTGVLRNILKERGIERQPATEQRTQRRAGNRAPCCSPAVGGTSTPPNSSTGL